MENLATLLLIAGGLAGRVMPPGCDTNDGPQVIAFTASWCCPCRQQAPVVDEIEAAGVKVTRIDIDQHPDLVRRYHVTAVPTYFFYQPSEPPFQTNRAGDVLMRIRQSR